MATYSETPPGRRYSFLLGADGFGGELKDALAVYLTDLGYTVRDLGTRPKYYEAAAAVAKEISDQAKGGNDIAKGILVCGTGMGMSIVANKYPNVYAAVCESQNSAKDSRSINNSNILTLGAKYTSVDRAKEILDAWLSHEFKAATPANEGQEWGDDIRAFLDNSMQEIPQLRAGPPFPNCPLCTLGGQFEGVPGVEGAVWKLLRRDRTTAVVRFPANAYEPPHHHGVGHDVYIINGDKTVSNLSVGDSWRLKAGDHLYTPAGQVHSVKYHADTEIFFSCDGEFDMIWDSEQHGVIMPSRKYGDPL